SEITGYAYRLKENGEAFGVEDLAAWLDIPGGASTYGYTVTGLTNGTEYKFELRAENEHGGGIPAKATVRLPVTVSDENEELPAELTLMGNYPNPFNPETAIDYALPQAGPVRLAVYDMTGKTVAVLVDGMQPQGRHAARFNAEGLPTGTYIYRLTAGAETLTRTMTLVR
ncbi:MAG: T9SS type A sorting domain-containing protein, partial [Bacteroidetes bacterium SB0668_bin_1]|nr:T9SS type A sorting domain-containing protein [Bacteroidetes bacterium SB0668_bin_1]